MGLRIFPVVGEALHFGGRRMETIARIAWLPLLLSMVTTMAAVFAMLSVIEGRLITFQEVPDFIQAQQRAVQSATQGFQSNPDAMWTITIASIAAQTLLTASFMAPLIRYAGLGEKPAPGLIRAPFGPDQVRFVVSSIFGALFVAVLVFGPVAAASYYTLKYIVAALSQTMATFPDPNSLHTIEITTAADEIAAQGRNWIYERAIPLSGAAPVAILFWLLLFFHFAPQNRPGASAFGRTVMRAVTTFVVAAASMLIAYFLFSEIVLNEFRSNTTFLGVLGALGRFVRLDMSGFLEGLDFLLNSPAGRLVFFGVASFFVMNYLSLRLFPYPGVAVCRKSLAPGNMLAVTRGWDIIRLWVIVTFLTAFLVIIQVLVLNLLLLQIVFPMVIAVLYEATAVSRKLVNSGEAASWVQPMFIWVWNIVKVIVNVIWSFFSFGVAAGLYGRLYRESEAAH
ncbi:MAG: hypothetical protein AAFW68_00490 [Pseudomonadota bacterium]